MNIKIKIFENEDFIINENKELDTIEFSFNKGKFDKSFAEFLKNYPKFASSVIKIGTDALAAYKTSKNMTTRFYARSTIEKKLYSDIADKLIKSGDYRQITKKLKNGGLFLELIKV